MVFTPDRRPPVTTVSNTLRPWRWITLFVVIALLNVSLTFRNVWPTPGIAWTSHLSTELAVIVLGIAWAVRRFGSLRGASIQGLAVAWLLLVLGRYADVTAPAFYGREVNLYWDTRHLGAVVAMMAPSLPPWLLVGIVVVSILALLLAHRVAGMALGFVAEAMQDARARRGLTTAAFVACALFVGQRVTGGAWEALAFSTPVSESYARQVRLLATRGANRTRIPAAARLEPDLSGLAGADVFVIFVESYGAAAYDNPRYTTPLAPSRAQLASDIAATGRHVVSGFVESPTFGGSSWLAHISLLTGVEVRDEDTNVRLMAERRDTMVTAFSRGGYRTVAAMPGNSHPWPEGAFYGYDAIHDRARLDYRGPKFGWWYVPDQFTLARLDQIEAARSDRKPLFVVMPTISTHAPFGPTAPYQPDWGRLLSDEPYAPADAKAALARKPDLLDMGPSYVNAIAYTYASIGGYLRMRAERNIVMIVLGDHQPAAAVSGEGASWDVPVHVVASRPELLERLEARGFTEGLNPNRKTIGRMHGMLPVLLGAFGHASEPEGSAPTSTSRQSAASVRQ
jgi:hypothetical protein